MEETLYRDADPLKVKLSKGMKGEYGWEVSAKGNSVPDIIKLIQSLDAELRGKYLTKEE